MKTVPVQLRSDKQTGRPVLFFRNANPLTTWLECFDRAEGHSECSEAYRLQCEPFNPAALPDDARRLLEFWNSIPGGPEGRPVARLGATCAR